MLNVVRFESHWCTLPSSFISNEEKLHKAPRETKTNALFPSPVDTVCSHWTYNRVADATANGDSVHTEELSCDSELNECRSAIVRAALSESYQPGCLLALYQERPQRSMVLCHRFPHSIFSPITLGFPSSLYSVATKISPAAHPHLLIPLLLFHCCTLTSASSATSPPDIGMYVYHRAEQTIRHFRKLASSPPHFLCKFLRGTDSIAAFCRS